MLNYLPKPKDLLYRHHTGFEIYAEVKNDVLFFHTKIGAITPSLFKDIHKVWAEIKSDLKSIGWREGYSIIPDNKKIEKWGSVWGFKTIDRVKLLDEIYLVRKVEF